MTPELAEISRTLDPAELGRRIKNARIAAGMTQAQVAGEDITTAYVSRIEDGQRRPQASLLERMAKRMGVSLEELLVGVSATRTLELQLAVGHAELELASGNADRALVIASGVLVDIADLNAPPVQRSAAQVRAFALEATGDLDAAIMALEELIETPAADFTWLNALIALSRCYRDSGDSTRAIAVGEKAEAEIERLGITGLTEAIQLTTTVAAAHMIRGDVDHAMRMCKGALAAAEAYNSSIGRASAYWEASILESSQGKFESAIGLARQAIAIFEVGEDARDLARLRSEIASIHLEVDPPDPKGAIETLVLAERETAWSSTTTYDRARALLTRARAYFLLGEHDRALEFARRTLELAPDGSLVLRATVLALEGQVAAEQSRMGDARDRYEQAVLVLSGIGADHEAAQLWFDLGGLLSEVGETMAALDAFRRAAASTGLRTISRRRAAVAGSNLDN